jgi:hypothetical protein
LLVFLILAAAFLASISACEGFGGFTTTGSCNVGVGICIIGSGVTVTWVGGVTGCCCIGVGGNTGMWIGDGMRGGGSKLMTGGTKGTILGSEITGGGITNGWAMGVMSTGL